MKQIGLRFKKIWWEKKDSTYCMISFIWNSRHNLVKAEQWLPRVSVDRGGWLAAEIPRGHFELMKMCFYLGSDVYIGVHICQRI